MGEKGDLVKIGLLKETKKNEGRVALTPENIGALVRTGHRVCVQKGAGELSSFADSQYKKAGARLLHSSKEIILQSDLLLKVKEPTMEELEWMRPGQMIFCYLHLAAFPRLTQKILRKKIIALGYETLQAPDGHLPLLIPMSQIAGRLATQNGAHLLRIDQGGRGVLMGGTDKVPGATVVILGAGVVGENAAQMAMGLGATVHILDVFEKRLQNLKRKYGDRLHVHPSTSRWRAKLVPIADLLIGAVLIPGAKAPKLVSKTLVKKMKKGSVIIDVAVDQGGCIETSEVTSHENPAVVKHGVLHYGVPNIPAVVPLTSTLALSTETFPYVLRIAHYGLVDACKRWPELKGAINCYEGKIIHPALL